MARHTALDCEVIKQFLLQGSAASSKWPKVDLDAALCVLKGHATRQQQELERNASLYALSPITITSGSTLRLEARVDPAFFATEAVASPFRWLACMMAVPFVMYGNVRSFIARAVVLERYAKEVRPVT